MKASFNYKYFVDEDIGLFNAGFAYHEFDGEIATRQLQIYVDGWLSSDFGFLFDQPPSKLIDTKEEITAGEFEDIWQKFKGRQSCNK